MDLISVEGGTLISCFTVQIHGKNRMKSREFSSGGQESSPLISMGKCVPAGIVFGTSFKMPLQKLTFYKFEYM